MNKNTMWWWIGIIVVVIIIIIVLVEVGGYTNNGGGTSTTIPSTSSSTVSSSATVGAQAPFVAQSFRKVAEGLLAAGGPEVCEVNGYAGSGSVNANLYVADGEIRSDLTYTVGGQVADTAHSLIDSNTGTMYVWANNMNVGYKFPWSSTTTIPSYALPSDLYRAFVNPGTFGYSCSSWKPNTYQFTLPTNVTFNSSNQKSDKTFRG